MIQPYVDDENFFLTYGDGVSDVNINELLNFHTAHGKICTITAIKPESRFGYLDFDGDKVLAFREKSKQDVGWINAGYMVLSAKVFDYISGDVMLEQEPMKNLTRDGEVMAFRHDGFWQCMDTLRATKISLRNFGSMMRRGKFGIELWIKIYRAGEYLSACMERRIKTFLEVKQ